MAICILNCRQRPENTGPMGVHMETHDKFVTVAPAKLNINLDVSGRTIDGYHPIRSIMQAIEGRGLGDPVRLHVLGKPGKYGNVMVDCTEDTITIAACRRLEEESGKSLPALITIEKSIPIGVGLGGGSSDAAAALRLLNVAFDLGYTVEQLAFMSQPIGNDVPFLVYGGRASVSMAGKEIGNIIRLLPKNLYYVVCLDSATGPFSTEIMYRLLDEQRRDWKTEKPLESNDFASLVFRLAPSSRSLLEILRKEGNAVESGVTGKGPAVFAGYGSYEEASAVKAAVRQLAGQEVRVRSARSSDAF